MAETLFESGNIRVTDRAFYYGGTTYPINSIMKVSAYHGKMGSYTTLLVNVGLFAVGLIAFLGGFTGGLGTLAICGIGGLIAMWLGGANAKSEWDDIKNPNYFVEVEMASGDAIKIDTKSEETAQRFRDAIHTAQGM